jgi:hypothetical protein
MMIVVIVNVDECIYLAVRWVYWFILISFIIPNPNTPPLVLIHLLPAPHQRSLHYLHHLLLSFSMLYSE